MVNGKGTLYYPASVVDENGKVIDSVITNEKGYKKSLEQKMLWHLHGATGRLLPYMGGLTFKKLNFNETWIRAELDKPSADKVKNAETGGTYTGGGAPETGGYTGIGTPSGHSGPPAAGEFTQAGAENFSPNQTAEILATLEKTITKRKTELPEGSYTTHLFSSGPEKIRKKAGEEAIELILADTPEQQVYEAADLIYHMMVLFASENIPFGRVVEELQKRTK